MMFTTKSGKATVYAGKAGEDAAVNVGVDSELGSGFVSIPAGKRELIHAASAVGAAMLLRGLAKKTSSVKRAQKDAQRRMKQTGGARKDPRRSTGMNLNVGRLRKRKRR